MTLTLRNNMPFFGLTNSALVESVDLLERERVHLNHIATGATLHLYYNYNNNIHLPLNGIEIPFKGRCFLFRSATLKFDDGNLKLRGG